MIYEIKTQAIFKFLPLKVQATIKLSIKHKRLIVPSISIVKHDNIKLTFPNSRHLVHSAPSSGPLGHQFPKRSEQFFEADSSKHAGSWDSNHRCTLTTHQHTKLQVQTVLLSRKKKRKFQCAQESKSITKLVLLDFYWNH